VNPMTHGLSITLDYRQQNGATLFDNSGRVLGLGEEE
jgi:hypothetical protein